MLKSKNLLVLVALLVAITSFSYILLKHDPPIYKSRIILGSRMRAVQDSMVILRQTCERFKFVGFISCTVTRDSSLFFDTETRGKLDSITPANTAFATMEKADAVRLLSTLKFLYKNRISGVCHDVSIGDFWLYPYDEDLGESRKLYLWRSPKDTLAPAFKRNFKILDRKENILLLSQILNDRP